VHSLTSRVLVVAGLALAAQCTRHATDGDPASTAVAYAEPASTPLAAHRSTGPARAHDTLVLFDDTGPYAWLGELYATALVSLASHFGGWAAAPVARYRAGDARDYGAVVYLGSTFDQPLPEAFLDDVLHGVRPVMWIAHNVWQLQQRDPSFVTRFGFATATYDTSEIRAVRYKATILSRSPRNTGGVMRYAELDGTKTTTLAQAVRADGSLLPWAVRSGSLTYVGEAPFAFIDPGDRYLAFCDLLFDTLAPGTTERHRGLVRIEDVHPETPPEALRALTDRLSAARVPYSLAVIPVYRDPNGAHHGGAPREVTLADAPGLVEVLRHALGHGGHLVLHGLSHQYANAPNPYDGVTASDFEFFRAHLGAAGETVLDGPVAEDGAAWALARVDRALLTFDAAGLPRPSVFEYPHYAGSVVDSRAIRTRFDTVYQRETYVSHTLAGGTPDYAHTLQLYFPFVVDDIYGWRVLPENLGYYAPAATAGVPAHGVADIVAAARAGLVVRDGFASFFFHPTFDADALERIVVELQALGYEFTSPQRLKARSPPGTAHRAVEDGP
jgi:uncharacterized protein YdaL